MDIKNVVGLFSNASEPEKIHWGGGFGLWDACRHKVVGIPVLDILLDKTQDPELRALIEHGINGVAIPNVEKLQSTFKESGLTYPPLPQRKNIDDRQIAQAITEILRLSLLLDTSAFMGVTRDDLRNILWEITSDDKKAFDKMIQLNRKKGWLNNAPNIIQ